MPSLGERHQRRIVDRQDGADRHDRDAAGPCGQHAFGHADAELRPCPYRRPSRHRRPSVRRCAGRCPRPGTSRAAARRTHRRGACSASSSARTSRCVARGSYSPRRCRRRFLHTRPRRAARGRTPQRCDRFNEFPFGSMRTPTATVWRGAPRAGRSRTGRGDERHDDDRREHAVGAERTRGAGHHESEPLGRAHPLRDDRADHRVRRGDLQPAKNDGSADGACTRRRRCQRPPPKLRTRSTRSTIGVHETVDGAHDDREERRRARRPRSWAAARSPTTRSGSVRTRSRESSARRRAADTRPGARTATAR